MNLHTMITTNVYIIFGMELLREVKSCVIRLSIISIHLCTYKLDVKSYTSKKEDVFMCVVEVQ